MQMTFKSAEWVFALNIAKLQDKKTGFSYSLLIVMEMIATSI